MTTIKDLNQSANKIGSEKEHESFRKGVKAAIQDFRAQVEFIFDLSLTLKEQDDEQSAQLV